MNVMKARAIIVVVLLLVLGGLFLTGIAESHVCYPETRIGVRSQNFTPDFEKAAPQNPDYTSLEQFLTDSFTSSTLVIQKEFDSTHLAYFGARYYDPTTGRFTNPDPFMGHLTDPRSQFMYGYGFNNPLMYLDSDGFQSSLVEDAYLKIDCLHCDIALGSINEILRRTGRKGEDLQIDFEQFILGESKASSVARGMFFTLGHQGQFLLDIGGDPIGFGSDLIDALDAAAELGRELLNDPELALMLVNVGIQNIEQFRSDLLSSNPVKSGEALGKLIVVLPELVGGGATAVRWGQNSLKNIRLALHYIKANRSKLLAKFNTKPIPGTNTAPHTPDVNRHTAPTTSTVEATAKGSDLFASVRGRNLSQLSRAETGAIGENILKTWLSENGYTDIIAIQNRSGHGLDVVARSVDGRISYFEVKTSAVGQVGNLSARQKNMKTFVENVLNRASQGIGHYRRLDVATQDLADDLLQQFLRNPENISGNAVGIDLQNEILRVSKW